jgi:amino acid adenylation domain-containing protein
MRHLANYFLKTVGKFPKNPALWVNQAYYTYEELLNFASPLVDHLRNQGNERVAIYSYRSKGAYVAILATLLADKAYVPLNPKAPLEKNVEMLIDADTQTLLVDVSADKDLEKLTLLLPASIKIYCLDNCLEKSIAHQTSVKLFKEESACLLFTSGSTGKPKGVMLSHENILAYLDHTILRYQLTAADRISQMTELTFDFSIQDIFISWLVGACVYAFPENYFLGLPEFIVKNKITFMTTVPSTIRLLKQFNKLSANSFPSLRQNIFGGEPLSDSMALAWQEAAPNTQIDNVCGPTEATIAFNAHPWHRDQIKQYGMRNCIPIGRPLPHQKNKIVDANMKEVPNGTVGELLLSGTQVSKQYWRNPALDKIKYVELSDMNGISERWYRTGDLALWNDDVGIIFKGRLDDQLQIRGYRVEKLEIEKAIKEAAHTEFVAVIPWPVMDDGTIHGIVAYISHSHLSDKIIYATLRQKLDDHMIPKKIIRLDAIPLNLNGKIDYIELKNQVARIAIRENSALS